MPATIPEVICSTGSFWMWELDRTLGTLAEAGFEAVELMVTRDPRTQKPEVIKRLADKEGVRVAAVHAPMLVVTRRIWGPDHLKIIDRSTDLARRVGAEVVVIHPPYLWELGFQRWLVEELDRYTATNQVSIAVENMFRLWIRQAPVRGHRWVSPADLDRFSQVTLDTSHCGVDGFDILEALDILGPRIAHVHLSDSLDDHRDSHALPGKGSLPLDEFVRRLVPVGVQGAVSLELDMRAHVGDDARLLEELRRARGFALEHLG